MRWRLMGQLVLAAAFASSLCALGTDDLRFKAAFAGAGVWYLTAGLWLLTRGARR